jgi:hypothetical protein
VQRQPREVRGPQAASLTPREARGAQRKIRSAGARELRAYDLQAVFGRPAIGTNNSHRRLPPLAPERGVFVWWFNGHKRFLPNRSEALQGQRRKGDQDRPTGIFGLPWPLSGKNC